MFDEVEVEKIVNSRFIQSLDVSMFEISDIGNVVLQRSEVLYGVSGGNHAIRAWMNGNSGPMDDLAKTHGLKLVRRAIAVLYREFLAMKPTLDGISPKSIADIGCGYAFFDLFASRDYQADIVLIDIEENEERHFGFEETGSAYTSLNVAKKFLLANGLSPEKLTLINPQKEDLAKLAPVELAVSFLSCGFHYPTSVYNDFWKNGIVAAGHILLDVRGTSYEQQMEPLLALGTAQEMWSGQKWRRMILDKGVSA